MPLSFPLPSKAAEVSVGRRGAGGGRDGGTAEGRRGAGGGRGGVGPGAGVGPGRGWSRGLAGRGEGEPSPSLHERAGAGEGASATPPAPPVPPAARRPQHGERGRRAGSSAAAAAPPAPARPALTASPLPLLQIWKTLPLLCALLAAARLRAEVGAGPRRRDGERDGTGWGQRGRLGARGGAARIGESGSRGGEGSCGADGRLGGGEGLCPRWGRSPASRHRDGLAGAVPFPPSLLFSIPPSLSPARSFPRSSFLPFFHCNDIENL